MFTVRNHLCMNHPAWPLPFNTSGLILYTRLTILTHLRMQQEQGSSPGAGNLGTPHGSGRAGLRSPCPTRCPSLEQLGPLGRPWSWAPPWLCGCLRLGWEPLGGPSSAAPLAGKGRAVRGERLVLLLGCWSRGWWPKGG